LNSIERPEEDLLQNVISLDGSISDFPHEMLEILTRHRVIAVGERHGSCEIPAFVSTLAQQLLKEGPSLSIALEIDIQNQAGLDAYVETLDENVLLSIPHFASASDDGRASLAMAALIQTLATKPNVKFCAFDAHMSAWRTPDDQGRDSAMAENLNRFVVQYPSQRVLVLCGNVHSSNSVGSFFDPNFRPMIYELCHQHAESSIIKPDDIYSILVDFDSGQTWSKSSEHSTPPTTWHSNNSRFSEPTSLQSYFLPFGKEKFHGHDALVFIRILTASPPFTTKHLS
jgi:erythromycin esterase-like protein